MSPYYVTSHVFCALLEFHYNNKKVDSQNYSFYDEYLLVECCAVETAINSFFDLYSKKIAGFRSAGHNWMVKPPGFSLAIRKCLNVEISDISTSGLKPGHHHTLFIY